MRAWYNKVEFALAWYYKLNYQVVYNATVFEKGSVMIKYVCTSMFINLLPMTDTVPVLSYCACGNSWYIISF